MSMFRDFLVAQEKKAKEDEAALNLPIKRMYANERDSFLQFHMCKDILDNLNKEIAERIEMAGATEEMQEAARLVKDALKRVYFTVPEHQRRTIDNNAANVTYAIGVKTPGSVGIRSGDSNWGLYVSYADIGTMCGALHDHCVTCMGSAQEQECCELRKVFDRLGVNVEHVNGECGYRELI